MRRLAAVLATLALMTTLSPPVSAAAAGAVRVTAVTANEQVNPLGIGTPAPRFGWVLAAAERAQRQSGYRVLVASTPARLRPGAADVWDSGTVRSGAQFDVTYAGPALRSSTRYHWSVQVLDVRGRASEWSRSAWFETGLLSPGDWTGQWIAGRAAEPDPPEHSFAGASWVWYPEGTGTDFPAATRFFRAAVTLPDKPVRSAVLIGTADDEITAYLDGARVLASTSWEAAQRADVTSRLHPGRVVLAARATNTSAGPAGVLARLRVTFTDGSVTTYDTGTAAWRAEATAPIGWEQPGFDDAAWSPVRTLAVFGSGPWGDRARVDNPPPPAPLLRTDFTVTGPVARARLYYSSPGYGELSVNGQRLGDAVLDPGFTRFDKRVQYATRDVTAALKPGANTLGAVLGRGFYGLTTRNVWDHHTAPWHGDPRLRAQLRIDYTDGRTQTVASDGGWRTHDSATVADSIYAGETYDARRKLPGWDTPWVDPADWAPARVVTSPSSTVVAQENEPIKVVKTHRATTITSPKPGTHVFAFPVMIAGWARLRVTGPAGTEVTLRYGEKLRADGTVNHDNSYVTGEHQVDHYLLRGGGREEWEPRFSYKGFTYVQVDGFPGTPTADSVQARELHTAVPDAGTFTSSNPLLNRVHAMSRQAILNNLHGLPTDTPMYEKNGWMGDALMTVDTAIHNFGMQRIYRKWLDDVRDSQFPDGMAPLIAPTGGWGRQNSVEWGAAYPLIVWAVYQHYGDRTLVAEHYDAIKRYVDYLATQARADGTHNSGLGDWVPPGFHGTPPEGAVVSATAYVALVARTVASMAQLLGKAVDAQRFTGFADTTTVALNTRYLNRETGVYSTDVPVGYRQTPNVLPLAMGLTPADTTGKVLANLVADLHRKNDHLDTGILGTRYLLPLLTERGETELAYRIATRTTFPSWGYWASKGATAMWEMWDDNSRSLDHHMFGSVDQWFYEDLAGLKPTAPGYGRFEVEPHVPEGLTSASARVRTVRGDAASAWRKAAGGTFDLSVTVPVGATATVSVPAADPAAVTESGRPADAAPGVKFLRYADGRAVYTVGSGSYRFRSSIR